MAMADERGHRVATEAAPPTSASRPAPDQDMVAPPLAGSAPLGGQPAAVTPQDWSRWRCWIDVALDAVAANVGAIRRWIGAGVRLVAVVKAQAYGLGAEVVASAALDAGADGLAVARVREGIRLRR